MVWWPITNSRVHVTISMMMFTAAVVLVTGVCQAAVVALAVAWMIVSELILIVKSVIKLT